MRLFAGIELADDVRRSTADLSAEIRRRAGRLAPSARVTWVAPERLHVTLAFFGQLDEASASALIALLTTPFRGGPFDMTLAGLGTFPTSGAPRVVWAGVSAGRERLIELEHQLAGRLAALEVPADERAYQPHVTLARVREPGGLRSSALLEGWRDTVLGTTPVRAITLFESRLSPKGPTYVALQRTALAD